MFRLTMPLRGFRGLRFALCATALMLLSGAAAIKAQGLVQGVEQGAKAGNKAAGPVGGVLGGAIGGVVGVFTGVLGAPGSNNVRGPQGAPTGTASAPAKDAKTAKGAKAAKGAKSAQQQAEAQPLT